MPTVQSDWFLGSQPNTFINPLGHVVVLDFSISQVEPVSVRLEYVFIPGYDRAAWSRGIDPSGHRVRVVVSDRWIVFTKRASSSAVAVEPSDVAAELHEALAVEARRLPDLAGSEAWTRRCTCGWGRIRVDAGTRIDWRARSFRVLQRRTLWREITVE